MIGDTLTLENLRVIYEAMSKIKPIDQSAYFVQYFEEIKERLELIQKVELLKLEKEVEQELKDLEK